MPRAGRKPRGFSLLELAVALSIIGVLAAVLLNRLVHYQELAEKAAMESMLRVVKTGMQVRLAELIVTNRQGLAGELESEDPFRWLDEKPPNYGGRYRASPDPGAWYFDPVARELVYVVMNGDRLEIDGGAVSDEIRFRATLRKDKVRTTGIEVESVTGITLRSVRNYRWQ